MSFVDWDRVFMKIIYVANTRLPTEMAHGLQIMKMCEAFVKNGAELELIVPWRFSISSLGKRDPFEYYKVDKNFKIKKLFCFDLTPLNRFLGPISFLTQALSFSFFVSIYLLFKRADITYSRDRFSLFFINLFKKDVVLEIHQFHKSLFIFLLKRVRKIVVISKGLKDAIIKKGIEKEKILVVPDSIDLEDFQIRENREDCRRKLNLPLDKKIVLYTGHLYKWKGVETLALASNFLSENELIVIVGGIKWYLSNFQKFVKKNDLRNILILGHQDYSKIPYFLKSADCLVLTGTKKSKVSQYQTSPLKMFEYMASGVPIVASDLPSFREVLYNNQCESNLDNQRESEQNQRVSAFIANAILVEPDNPEAIAIGIKKVLNDLELSKKISEQAYRDVQKYTWDNRAKKILNFICAE